MSYSKNTTVIVGDFQKNGALLFQSAYGQIMVYGDMTAMTQDSWPQRKDNAAYIEVIGDLAREVFERFGTIDGLEVKLPN